MLEQLKRSRRLGAALALLSFIGLAPFLIARAAAPADLDWRRELRWSDVRDEGDRYVQTLGDGGRVELTIDPRLQRLADRVLADHPAPYAGAVILSVEDGRVLAMAGRSTLEPERTAAELTLSPWAPAASVFKLVTAAALVEAGLTPEARVCYHGGIHSVEADNLEGQPALDRSCHTLAYGLARSQNAIIARLVHDHLDPETLDRTGRAFGFGAPLPFELPVAPSEMAVPGNNPLAFARVAAGFWQTTLSPLHGAYLAATIARGGEAPPLRLVERVVDRQGNSSGPDLQVPHRVISEAAARAVGRMMIGTTEYGSARVGFRNKLTHRRVLPGIAVAGKTGSLNRPEADGPFLAYSWFVGFAPAEHPEVAIAVLLGNDENGHVKAPELASELLADYFQGSSVPSPRRLASR